jgi:hypothetical protein
MRLDLRSLTDSKVQTKTNSSHIMLKGVTDYAIFAVAAVLTKIIGGQTEL